MKRPFAAACVSISLCASASVRAQVPAPTPLSPQQKAAAAAVEAPRPLQPPPVPGQLQNREPEKTDAATSKMQALEAVTRQPALKEAPRVTAPANKLPVTTSTSTSGQFIVHGKVFETRSKMSSRCEEISQELRKLLNDKEAWGIPIVVVLNTGEDAAKTQGPPVATVISEMTHGGFHIQVTISERPGLSNAALRKEIVRALLAERILRGHQKLAVPEGRLLLPDWVMTGVLHALEYKAAPRPSAVFATIFRSGKIYGIEEIISASPVEMDGLSRSIYDTSCCALVLALIDQPDGSRRFNRFLNTLASDPRTERALLDAAFPGFTASASSLNKWWALQLAALSKPGIAERLSPSDSLKAIAEAILIHYEAAPNDVPKNIQMHPFTLPPPLEVAAHPSPPQQAAEDALTPSTHPKETSPTNATASAAAEEESPSKAKRPLWRRLLFLGDAKEDPPETAPVEEKNDGEKHKPSFFDRMLGLGSEEKQEPASKAATPTERAETEPSKPAKPAETSKESAPKESRKKPSKLNPLNWFRSNSQDEEKPKESVKETKPAKDQTSTFSFFSNMPTLAYWLSPTLAEIWHWLAIPQGPRLTADRLLFDFRKKKTPPADEVESRSKQEPPAKKSATKPAAEPKKETKPSSTQTTSNKPPARTHEHKRAASGATLPKLVPVVLPLEEFQHLQKRTDRATILEANVTALRALDMRVAPLFRPVVAAYLAAVIDLQADKTGEMSKRLAALHQFAIIAYQKSVAVRDYLDWYEANEGSRLSGKFDDYLSLPEILKQELPPRTDPISKYLDALEKEFAK